MTIEVTVRRHGVAQVVAVRGVVDEELATVLGSSLAAFGDAEPVVIDASQLRWDGDPSLRRILTPAVTAHPGRLVTTALVVPRHRQAELVLDGAAPHVAVFGTVADALQALVLADAGYGSGWDEPLRPGSADDER
ncbi:MAG: hypothetical protein ACLGI8_05795 [Acidimicrobiia bacterium]